MSRFLDQSTTVHKSRCLRRHALQERLAELAARLEGLQRSFECIQDCVRAYSPRLWHDELAGFVRCAAAHSTVSLRSVAPKTHHVVCQ